MHKHSKLPFYFCCRIDVNDSWFMMDMHSTCLPNTSQGSARTGQRTCTARFTPCCEAKSWCNAGIFYAQNTKPVCRFRLLSPFGELRQGQKAHGNGGIRNLVHLMMQMRSVRFCSLANKSCWSNSQVACECSESRFQEVLILWYSMQMPF